MQQAPLLSLGQYANRILRLMKDMAQHPRATPQIQAMLHVASIGVQQTAKIAQEQQELPRQSLQRMNNETSKGYPCQKPNHKARP